MVDQDWGLATWSASIKHFCALQVLCLVFSLSLAYYLMWVVHESLLSGMEVKLISSAAYGRRHSLPLSILSRLILQETVPIQVITRPRHASWEHSHNWLLAQKSSLHTTAPPFLFFSICLTAKSHHLHCCSFSSCCFFSHQPFHLIYWYSFMLPDFCTDYTTYNSHSHLLPAFNSDRLVLALQILINIALHSLFKITHGQQWAGIIEWTKSSEEVHQRSVWPSQLPVFCCYEPPAGERLSQLLYTVYISVIINDVQS